MYVYHQVEEFNSYTAHIRWFMSANSSKLKVVMPTMRDGENQYRHVTERRRLGGVECCGEGKVLISVVRHVQELGGRLT